MSNSAPAFTGLSYTDVESSLLTEEMNRRNNQSGKASSALNARGRSQSRGRDTNGKSRSKSRSKKDMECFYCGKKGHIQKFCFKWKADKKAGKVESKGEDANAKDVKGKGKSSVKIEELNAVTDGAIVPYVPEPHVPEVISFLDVLFVSNVNAHSLIAGDLADKLELLTQAHPFM